MGTVNKWFLIIFKFLANVPCTNPNKNGKQILKRNTIGNLNDNLRDKRSISD